VPELRVRLLRGLDLRLDGEPLPPLGSARAEALLAYLLLNRDAPQPRQRIAFLLWPDSTEAQARTNLRHLLHTLRRELPDADRLLEVTQRTLQWRAPVWLDVAEYERALDEDRLADAVATYGGDLLEGHYEDWVLEERERLRARYVDALERLARDLGDVSYAERLVREDPLREDAHRLLIGLHDARGDRARALRAYHVCAATLERELGIEPSAATRAAYDALLPRAGDGEAAAPAGAPLVGRAAERARLTALWREAEGGAGRLVLVTGEPGIGKSRLVEELRIWCAHRGAVTAEARSYAAEGSVAYGAVIAWLRAEPIGARLGDLEEIHRGELARLLPELGAAPEPLPEGEQRRRLFEALARALPAPLLLVADDLQWCDPETLRFLHYLLREPGRLLVAATARREEIDAGGPVSELITALQALGRCDELALDRLGRDETRVLAERLAGRRLEPREADRLYGDSEGNPLFLVESVRAGGAPDDSSGEAVRAGGSRVEAVIAGRLARLSSEAAELAGVAAALGREFTAEVLAEASGADDAAFVRGLDELWRRGIVRAQGPSAYDFSHGRIRDAAYAALGPAQRRDYHLRAARAVEGAAIVAAHYEAAGAVDEAVAWHLRAAEAAQRLHANEDAVRSLERALALNRDDARELEILTALPAALVVVEGFVSDRLAEVHERALELAGALGVEPQAPLLRSLALASLTRGDFAAAQGFGERLYARPDDVLRVEGAYVLGVAAYWQGELEEAAARLAEVGERYRPEHRAVHLLRYGQDPEPVCRIRLAHTLWLLGRHDEAVQRRDEALALAARGGHPFTQALTLLFAAIMTLDAGDEARLRRLVDDLRAAEQSITIHLVCGALAAYVDVLDGRREGIGRIREALERSLVEQNAPGQPGLILRVLLEACLVTGDAETGLAAADRAPAIPGARLWEPEIRRLRGRFF
jgi:DNA-binding SARP family transcriptional activator